MSHFKYYNFYILLIESLIALHLYFWLLQGLVVPVIRDVDTLNFAEIEKTINNLAKKASNGTISIDEMAGGTFTISNGGVYGSLLSTPIINPPQVSSIRLVTLFISVLSESKPLLSFVCPI